MSKRMLRRMPKSALPGAKALKKVQDVEKRAKKRKKVLQSKMTLGIRSLEKDKPSKTKLKGLCDGVKHTINGRHYIVKMVERPIPTDIRQSELLLWDENSRMVELTPEQRKPTQIQLFNTLAARNDVKTLTAAMKANGGPIRGEGPPIGAMTKDGKIEILEGNERVVAAILNAQEDSETFKTITIQVYEGLTKADALALLATIHGKGKSPHAAVKIARLHWNAIESSGMTPQQYAKSLGLNISRLNILLASYNMCNWYLSHYENTKGDKTFSYFAKLVDQPGFRQQMGMQPTASDEDEGRKKRGRRQSFDPRKGTNSEFFKEFCEWLAASKITDCIQVDSLQLVLDHPQARTVFLKAGNNFYDAWKVLQQDRPELKSEFWADLNSLRDFLSNVTDADMQELLNCSNDSPEGKLWSNIVALVNDVEKKRQA